MCEKTKPATLLWLNTTQFPGARNANILKLVIIYLIRLLALVTMRVAYRLKVIGAHHVPVEGPALLIPNHVSWVDALLLSATNRRRIRFVMEREIYRTPFLHGLFRLMGGIPVSSGDGKRELVEFVRRARAALDEGYLVCIFAEGALTRNGMLQEFRPGFERIAKNSGHPVIPVYIGGVWGSIFSHYRGRHLSGWPSLSRRPVTILFGKPMDDTSSARQVRLAVAELSCDYLASLKPQGRPLGEYRFQAAKDKGRSRAPTDAFGEGANL